MSKASPNLPEIVACPRCGIWQDASSLNAGSRIAVDRDRMICGLCGILEAMRDMRGLAPIPPDEWPVAPAELGREFAIWAAVGQGRAEGLA